MVRKAAANPVGAFTISPLTFNITKDSVIIGTAKYKILTRSDGKLPNGTPMFEITTPIIRLYASQQSSDAPQYAGKWVAVVSNLPNVKSTVVEGIYIER